MERYYSTAIMTQGRSGVIINPISGRRGSRPGEALHRRAFVERHAAALGVDIEVHLTQAQGHARDLARACVAAGCTTVVAMGGDGTVNEVAQGLLGTDVPLGIVPCGSGDGLAHGLRLPTAWSKALPLALTGPTLRMDVGYANDRLFLNVAGVGFDAAVGQLFATRTTRGALGYIANSFSLVWSYRSSHYEIECDAGRRSGEKFLVGFANAPEYGNGAVMAPDADVTDGLLDVVIADGGSPLRQIWRARRLYWNRRAPAEGMERLRTRTATVTGSHLVCHVDGEVFSAGDRLDVRVEPNALTVRA